MFCFKKIVSYFDAYVNGEKKGSCGYAKLLVKDETVTIEIQIKDMTRETAFRESDASNNAVCEIWTEGEYRKQIGRFVIEKGTGCYYACHYVKNLDGQGLSLFTVHGLKLVLSEDNYCLTEWKWGKLPEEVRQESEKEETEREKTERDEIKRAETEEREKELVQDEALVQNERESAETKRTETEERERSEIERAETEEKERDETKRTERDEIKRAETEDREKELVQDEALVQNDRKSEEEERGTQEGACDETERTEEFSDILKKSEMDFLRQAQMPQTPITQAPLYEDKWKQLCSTYPVCHPFGAEEEYIAITLKDFVILRKEYQNLVSNSFLLHSFYNYHHVILGKMEPEEEIYYVGAPGNYFDREKRVAVMFGFEGFARSALTGQDGEKENGGAQAKYGDFGYYMKKVEI